MQTLPSPASRAAPSCPSPVAIWQTLHTRLLEQNYGLSLNDTRFGDEKVIQEHIDAGISLADALNFIVEKSELVRIDRSGFSALQQSPFISATDLLRARCASGLLKCDGYKAVRRVINGRAAKEMKQ